MLPEEHRFLTKKLIDNFNAKGFEISFADYGGYEKPYHVKNFRPDVVGWDKENQLYHIGKTLTDKQELQSAKTPLQLDELSSVMMTKGRSAGKLLPFYIAVPEKLKTKLENTLVDYTLSSRNNIYCMGV